MDSALLLSTSTDFPSTLESDRAHRPVLSAEADEQVSQIKPQLRESISDPTSNISACLNVRATPCAAEIMKRSYLSPRSYVRWETLCLAVTPAA
ncbi:unnamed protein product [Arctogadus glacialis]